MSVSTTPRKSIPQSSPLRRAVANLSSGGVGTYYAEITHWWEKVYRTLEKGGYPPERGIGHPPELWGVEGRWSLPLYGVWNTSLAVYIYRMPSGNYEIINYLT